MNLEFTRKKKLWHVGGRALKKIRRGLRTWEHCHFRNANAEYDFEKYCEE